MGRIWMPGGGGGVDLDPITATASDVLAGKVIVDKEGNPLTGTMPNRGAVSQSLSINGSYTIPAGYHNGSGKVTQSIPTQGGSTTTPGTGNKTIVGAGRYVTGNIIVAGDPNLISANIVRGKTIFGVPGSAVAFPSGPLDIYNRGSWGSGYSAGSVSAVATLDPVTYPDTIPANAGSGYSGQVIQEASALQVKFGYHEPGGKASYYRAGFFLLKDINLAPYSKFNFVVSNIAAYMEADVISKWKSVDVHVSVYGTNIQRLAYSKYYNRGVTGSDSITPSGEVTGSIDISGINVTARLVIALYWRREMKVTIPNFDTSAYVHRLWFS